MRRLRPSLLALVLLLLAGGASALVARPAVADGEEGFVVELAGAVEADAVGDLAFELDLVFPQAAYDAIKTKIPDPRRFLQDLTPGRANYESVGATAAYDDAKHAVRLTMTQRGAVKNLGDGRWEFALEGNSTLVRTTPEGDARPAAWFRESGTWDNGIKYRAEYAYRLPAGAREARWDKLRKALSWRLPTAPAATPPRVTLDLRARDRLMSTIYKVYGLGSDATELFWVAKAVFRNEGGPARNLRVRYRLGGYGDWSPWSKHPEIAAGQTVVDVHYPVLDPSIARLRSNTPANLLVEYSYEDAAGRKYEDDASRKVVILGVNEYVFGNLTAGESFGTWEEEYNNAPLLAAWVTRNDPVVKQFAAMANRMAGGVGANTDQASAVRVLRACYELLQRNDFSYQHPPALLDKSVSFDAKTVQNVKLPRETIRDRSGTCIDLAILYAAMINALGLEPHLALIPGHCFPVVRMPDKKLYAVEVTGVQGGLRTGSADFDRVYAYGLEELQKAVADGRIYLLDLHDLWTKGIANPEIEDLPPDILQRWGITEEGRGGPTPGPGTGPTPSADVAAVVGSWGGPMGGFKIDDELVLDTLHVGVDSSPAWQAGVRLAMTFTRGGVSKQIVVSGIYEGATLGGGAVRFPATKLKRTDVATGEESQIDFYALTLRPGEDGRLAGAFEGEGGFTFTLLPKPDETAPPAPAADLDALAGAWGGNMGGHDLGSGVLLDEMYVDATKGADGRWTAAVRMKLRLTQKGGIGVEIDATYTGGAVDGDAVKFAKQPWHRHVLSSGQKDDLDGYPLALRLKPDGGLSGTFEGDTQISPFGLLRREPPPSPLDAVAGAWGGNMGAHDIGSGVLLDEMYVDAAKGADGRWTAVVKMKLRLTQKDGLKVEIDATYPGGRVEGDAIKFTKQPWHRTVPSTGQKDDLDGNPLVLKLKPDGGLQGLFEGPDGMPFGLLRRGDEAPPAPAAGGTGLDALAGTWGGTLGEGRINDTLAIPEAHVTLVTKRFGVWTAEVDLRFSVTTPDGPVEVRLHGTYPPGRAEGDALKFATAQLERVVVATGERSTMDGNPLEVRLEPDGRAEVKFVGEGGFTLTLARAAGTPARTGPTVPRELPMPPAPDPKAEACVGSWGGRLDQTTPDGYYVETFTTVVSRAGPGVYEAKQTIVIRLTDGGRTDRLTVTGTYRGKAGGQGLVLPSTSRRRTLQSTGQGEDILPGTLELHVEGGKLTGRVGNATDGWTPFSLIPAR